ncbi:MAG: hypothetical protein MUO76_14000, partial [Anaerolineaceae bacterium]|nr:hypothetical protein [Anaerolineaceae bacterium]
MSITYLQIRLNPTVKHILKVISLPFSAALLFFSLTAFNQINSASPVSLYCRDSQPFIEVSGWSQGGPLAVVVDGEEIGQIALSVDAGTGSFSFGQSDQKYDVLLLNLAGNPIASGSINCTNQPLGFTYLSITPAEITLTTGYSLQFTATGEDESGTETAVHPIWISETGSITKDGMFSADVVGDYLIAASIANNETNLVAAATVHVVPLIDRIIIVPPVEDLSFGSRMLFTARGYDTDGNEILITPNWTAAEGEISPDGWYTATFWGEDTITATIPGSEIRATASIETGPPLERLEITPDEVSLWLGETLQFTATGYDANGDEMPITPHWSAGGGNITYFGLYSA